jgi:HEAT repeat protein
MNGEETSLERRCERVQELSRTPGEEATGALVALLEDPSWYLRERVVEALAARAASPAARRVLRTGAWYARASACDVIARCPDPGAVDDLLEQIVDRNVSLQKSASRALARVAEAHGNDEVARRVASREGATRRRILARVGHQEPAWALELERALAGLPRAAFATSGPAVRAPAPVPAAETRALVRFRRWLAGGGSAGAGP